jgi:hypothetical protein
VLSDGIRAGIDELVGIAVRAGKEATTTTAVAR